ncbi:hypothetical protein Trydic_g3251 [Trypoxylus dichotomus]
MAKFDEAGSTIDKPWIGRPRISRTAENVESVRQSVRLSHGLSVRRRASTLSVPKSSIHLHSYKLQLVQELKPTDTAERLKNRRCRDVQYSEPNTLSCAHI